MSTRWRWVGLLAGVVACSGSLRPRRGPFHSADCYVFTTISDAQGQAWEIDAGPGSELATIGPWQPENDASELRASVELKHATRGKYCNVTMLLDKQGSETRALDSWQRVRADQEFPRTIHSIPHWETSSGRAGAKAGKVSGRLPPELIQGIVRAHFGDFRVCYEKGLARNAGLEGKVVTRFVIENDGTVKDVADAGSTMPDAGVRDCVINSFKRYRFPLPEGGTVTVVYPIMLAPG